MKLRLWAIACIVLGGAFVWAWLRGGQCGEVDGGWRELEAVDSV